MTAHEAADAIPELLRQEGIRCVYQPVVDLVTRQLVAYEALMRGPAGSPLESPVALLAAARGDRDFAALDRVAHRVALDEMVAHPDAGGQALFLNIEPRGIGQALPSQIAVPWERAREAAIAAGLDVVIELTERALVDDPGVVMWSVEQMRGLGARIALDDVGASAESLAFLPLVRPDIVKLDLRLVREHGTAEVAAISNAVRAYGEETGAAVVAEGVESEADHLIAVSLGATLGQGWLYGRPAPLPTRMPAHLPIPRVTPAAELAGSTPYEVPYEVVASRRTTRIGRKEVLLPISRSLEEAARRLAMPPLLLASFQRAEYFTAGTASRYTELAQRLPVVGALGRNMPATPADGVRGAALADQETLAGEWSVIVLGAHYAAALVGSERGETAAEAARTFEYVVTHDRALVTAAAQTLLRRLLRTP
jgi:EAL domain-containing protein (putative c-di-GMP-specific phosphodiesterase class I)